MGKRTIIIILIVELLLIMFPAMIKAVENNSALTLKEAIFLALRNNANLKSAEIGKVAQKYTLVVAKHAFYPRYALQGSTQYSTSTYEGNRSSINSLNVKSAINLLAPYGAEFGLLLNNPVVEGHYNPSLTFEITQPLIRGFGRSIVEASLNNALDNDQINQLRFRNTVIDTINVVITDYMALTQAKETLKANNSSLMRYKNTFTKAKVMIKAGRMARNDIIQIQAQIASQYAAIENNKNNLIRAKGKLLNTLGLDAQANIQLPEEINYNEITAFLIGNNMESNLGAETGKDIEKSIKKEFKKNINKKITKVNLPSIDTSKRMVLINNIEYQILGITLKVLNRNLLSAKDAMKWKLDLTASATRGGRGGTGNNKSSGLEGIIDNEHHDEKIALNLTIPIDDVKAKKVVIDAQVGLDQAEVNYQQLRRQLELDVVNTHNAVINAKRQLDLSKQALELQRRTVKVARLKYNAGKISNFELLNNQKDLTLASQNYINNQINYIAMLVSFNKILGATLKRLDIEVIY